MSWARVTGLLTESDLFISADVDEIMSRQALQKLQWCKLQGQLITGALWMPVGSLDRALKSDYPVVGRPHSFGLPTIYHWGLIQTGQADGSRLQIFFKGSRDKYVLGGIHMTNSAFFPLSVLKDLTGTEYSRTLPGFFTNIFRSVEDINKQQARIYNLDNKLFWKNNTVPLNKANDIKLYVPWFLACNPHRFPYWFGQPDPRNKDLLLAMRRQKSL